MSKLLLIMQGVIILYYCKKIRMERAALDIADVCLPIFSIKKFTAHQHIFVDGPFKYCYS